MKNLASKLLRRRLRQVFLWPIEALFGFGLFYFARLLPTTFASAAMAAFLGIFCPINSMAQPGTPKSHLCDAHP